MAAWRPEAENRTELKLVQLSMLEREPSVENRIEEPDPLVIRSITASIRRGEYPPPVLVYRLPGNRHVPVDGRARVAAARAAGQTEIMAEIHPGTLVNATWAAAGTNRRPAQGRTPAEDRRALDLALQANPSGSPEAIAAHVGCSVQAIRRARPGKA